MQFFCRKTGNSWPFFRVSRANWAHICVFGHEDGFDCPVWGRGLRRTWIRILVKPGQTLACNRRYARLAGTRWDAPGKIGKTATNRSGSVSWAVLALAAWRGGCRLLHGGGRGGCCLLHGGERRYLLCGGVYWKKLTRGAATRRGHHERRRPTARRTAHDKRTAYDKRAASYVKRAAVRRGQHDG